MPIRDFLSVGLLALLLIPCSASAETTTEWSFANESFQEGWKISGDPSLAVKREGLFINTTAESTISRTLNQTNPIEVIAIDYRSDSLLEGWLYWHRPKDAKDELIRLPLAFSPTRGIGTLSIDMTKYANWQRHADYMGIELPGDSQLLIQSIRLIGWSPGEKLLESLKSFWTFDARKPSSVNFLWGPHIVSNPLAREVLFQVSSPITQSANRYFYLIMVFGLGWAWIKLHKHPDAKKKILTSLALLIASLWIFYDIRMGTEFLGYVQNDYKTYWSKPVGQRTFRERSYFNDFAAAITPLVQDRDSYIFIATHRWPYLGLIRYYTYPSIPTHPLQDERHVDTWVVYDRPDIKLNERGELTNEDIILSRPGNIIHEFAEGTFIFREHS